MNMFTNKLTVSAFKNVNLRYVNKKFKHRDTHWSVQAKKKNAIGKALEHFDDFYKTVFANSWPSIRQGLLADRKYVAVVNNYSNNENVMARLEATGAINIKTLFQLERKNLFEKQPTVAYNEEITEKNETIQVQNKKQTEKNNLANKKNNKLIESKNATEYNISLTENLKTAQLDNSRVIYPDNVELSSALYEFIPATKLKGKEDWIPETQYYQYYDSSKVFEIKEEKEFDLHFPEYLNVYCYETKNYTVFDSPTMGPTNVLDYYLLDGASLLPVLALGIKPGDKVLDLCAAPGGKSLIALQTFYPDVIVCNDVDYSRVKKIYNVFRQYLYNFDDNWLKTNRLKVLQEDGRYLDFPGFDCILVDVPCTNDKLSVTELENNWFKPSRIKERLQLPVTQAALLSNALKLVKVGGSVVYSTCTLSPIQNDGVVNMALKLIWEETNIQIIVKDLTPALKMTECIFKYSPKLRYGHLVVPYPTQNYGPMYFCKLQRVN